MTPVEETNAGRDRVEVFNRLDEVVLAIRRGDATAVETQMTPAAARRIADLLRFAAETGEQTVKS